MERTSRENSLDFGIEERIRIWDLSVAGVRKLSHASLWRFGMQDRQTEGEHSHVLLISLDTTKTKTEHLVSTRAAHEKIGLCCRGNTYGRYPNRSTNPNDSDLSLVSHQSPNRSIDLNGSILSYH